LKNDLYPAPQRYQLSAFQLGDVDAVEKNFAGGRAFEPQDAATRSRLAAAAFTDQPQGLAAPDP